MGGYLQLSNSPRDRPRRRAQLSIASLTVICLLLYVQFWFIPSRLHVTQSELDLAHFHLNRFNEGRQKCIEFNTAPVQYADPSTYARANSRWNDVSGQKKTTILRNVTLFNGDQWVDEPVNLIFHRGIFTAVTTDATSPDHANDAEALDLQGKYVTPGLVDMHSHHLVGTWPEFSATEDTNEVNDEFGPLTPFVRSLDSMKPYDFGTTIIRSGGITTSLILPGSANIMGGEAFIVKNVLRSGKDGEESVEEMLLEHGVPRIERRRYMKMACGENPKRVYKHTRMGNAWKFRRHMERAVELKTKQDEWCLAAASAQERGDAEAIRTLTTSTATEKGGLPEQLELESSVAILRGQVGVNTHCYEPEDFEDMLLHSKEFGFRIQAFHHALSAWKVPEMIKDSGENITVATFSDFGFYKHEAYDANLYAGKILEEHGVPVAYKSDHFEESTNAKYLLSQAAMAHSFGLSELKALQSVTSVPARSLEQHHRIGYVKVGYDADLVIWNSHPLSLGATPLQVYVDGKPTLDEKKVDESMEHVAPHADTRVEQQRIRPSVDATEKKETCRTIEGQKSLVINGIMGSYLAEVTGDGLRQEEKTLVVESGRVSCFDIPSRCPSAKADVPVLTLQNGFLLPGLTAVSQSLGLVEIENERSTTDGSIDSKVDVKDPEKLTYAKYGVHLEGRAFKRAQIGGVTKAVTIPLMGAGLGGGVSVGIKTNGKKTLLDGGIFQPEVGLHLIIGQASKGREVLGTDKRHKLKTHSQNFDHLVCHC